MKYDEGIFIFSLTVNGNEEDIDALHDRLVKESGIYLSYGFQGLEGVGELYLGEEGEFLCKRFPSLEWCCIHGSARDEDYVLVEHN